MSSSAVVGADAAFEVVYVGADGAESRVPLERAPRVPLELGRPVRSFPSYQGQRHYPGLYWSATVGGHVGFESWVERPVNRTSPGQATFPVTARNHKQ